MTDLKENAILMAIQRRYCKADDKSESFVDKTNRRRLPWKKRMELHIAE